MYHSYVEHYAIEQKVDGCIPDEFIAFVSIYLIPPALGQLCH
jgi:hypothetical protein